MIIDNKLVCDECKRPLPMSEEAMENAIHFCNHRCREGYEQKYGNYRNDVHIVANWPAQQ